MKNLISSLLVTVIFASAPFVGARADSSEQIVLRPGYGEAFANTLVFYASQFTEATTKTLVLDSYLALPEEIGAFDPALKIKTGFGLARNGQLFQVIQIDGRNFARLLSGERKIAQFELLGDELNLIARDRSGAVLYYDVKAWSRSPLKPVLTKFAGWSLGGAALAAITFPLLAQIAGFDAATAHDFNSLGRTLAVLIYTQTQAIKAYIDFLGRTKGSDGLVDAKIRAGDLSRLTPAKTHSLEARADLRAHWFRDCISILRSRKYDQPTSTTPQEPTYFGGM